MGNGLDHRGGNQLGRALTHFRRTTALLIVWVVVLAGIGMNELGAAQTDSGGFEEGKASAIANGITVDPRNGGLSFGITLGMALSDYTNTVARAESRSVDLGVIGVTLAAEKCDGDDPTWPHEDQPQPLRVTSNEEGSSEGKQHTEYGVFDRFVAASERPWSEATTKVAPFGEPGVFEVGPITTHTRTEVVDDATRVATAVTEIASINIGPLIEISGLRWEVTDRSGANEGTVADFTVGSVTVAGTPVVPPSTDGAQQLEALNDVLTVFGLRFQAPTMRTAGDVTFLSPLRISVIPAEPRDDILGGILAELHPVREQLTEALIAYDCGNGTYITVADIIVGSVTGAGAFHLELGGVQASTGTLNRFRFGSPDFQPLGNAPAPTPAPVVNSNTAAGPAPTPAPAPPSTPAPPVEQALPVVESTDSGIGLLAAVAGVGLALSLLLAELDRRKMKAAEVSVGD